MNYEELIETRDAKTQKIARTPLGNVYKQLIDKKYTNVVKIRQELIDNILFGGDIDYEYSRDQSVTDEFQLRFTPLKKGKDTIGLKLESGNFVSFENLLSDSPSIVARKNFIQDTVEQLLDAAETLHKQEIYHICYAPSNVMANRGNHEVRLLTHGSFYTNIKNRQLVFGEFEDFVAPEVFGEGEPDARSDIYSIGKFIEYLFSSSSVPMEYKNVIAKATSEDPSKRYQSAIDMKKDLQKKGQLFKGLWIFLGLALAALIIFGVYMELNPEPEEVEFVKPAPKKATDQLIEDGFDPEDDLGITAEEDSTANMTEEERAKLAEEEKKNEENFRRRYAAKAAHILNKVYNKENMDSRDAKTFMEKNGDSFDELSRLQTELGRENNLTNSKSQRIAAEVLEGLTQQKTSEMGE